MWTQLAAFGVGVWLTAAPAVLGSADPARANFHVVGPLAALFALVAAFEVTRPVRWLNLPAGAWLVLAPAVLGFDTADLAASVASGLALALLACVPGRRTASFGGGWRALWDPDASRAATGGTT